MTLLAACLGLWAAVSPAAWTQTGATPPPAAVALTTAPMVSLGLPLAFGEGPWYLGEVLFFSGGKLAIGGYAWSDHVRSKPGMLATRADILGDVDSLKGLETIESVTPSLYEIPGSRTPPEYAAIAVSTAQVRLVFDVTPKAEAAAAKSKTPILAPPAPVSGLVLTPTAYRGTGRFSTPGLGLDFNGMYVIGRLYGKNSFANSLHHTNYIDRVGLWLLGADGKMQLQSETAVRPAFAAGVQGSFLFRDSGQPSVSSTANPTVTVNASEKSTRILTDAYVVASKKFGPVRASAGLMLGDMGDAVAQMSEFLTPDALTFLANQPGQTVRSNTVPFVSLFGLPRKSQPLGLEIMKFNGAALNPMLINFKIGYFLHFNFDVGLLKFQGGYDLLGLLQFRFNEFPR
ncbi:MAG: hypothetical protein KGO96_06650 [Elusimicrobia bacterium]|nr:hypothetical protein [Elusimicrobiota bacterium]MDE2425570.1 hypothetical protein [Elusimicrobiota bacterium]